MKLTFAELAKMMDLSVVQAQHCEKDVRLVAEMAMCHACNAVFTLPCHTALLRRLIGDSEVAMGGVVGFPSGGATTEMKMVEANTVGEIFKCEICGNVVEVKEAGGGELVCCGEPMKPVK